MNIMNHQVDRITDGKLTELCILGDYLDIYLNYPLRKHAYSNILRILPPKYENFQMKNSDIFLISAQNIDCGYSLEPPR